MPVRFKLGPGQQTDMAPACELVCGLPTGQVIADRAYDANSLHDLIYEQGGETVIPPCQHRIYEYRYDRVAYKQRWGIEGFFARLKQWRRITTHYDKLASMMFWLK